MLRVAMTACSRLALVLMLTRCSVQAPDYAGKSCEAGACPGGYFCDAPSDTCRVAESQAAFVDTTFSGSFSRTRVTPEGELALADGQVEGTFISQVFDAGSKVRWESIAWVPLGAYGRQLPDLGAIEKSDGWLPASMTDNVLLLHMDGSEPRVDGQQLLDSSGRNNHAIVVSPLRFVEGRFGQAIADTRDSYAYVDLAKTKDFDFGTEDFTWALWVKTAQDCTGNKVHLGLDDGPADTPHLWLGCATGGHAGGTFADRQSAASEVSLSGKTTINDNRWHHLALVKKGHAGTTLKLFVDGQCEDVESGSFATPITYVTGPQLAIGAFSGGGDQYQAEGSFDEVAIWRRALGEEEIRALYLRGALRLAFQVRTCADLACWHASPFVGPANSLTAFFVDESDGSHAEVQASLSGMESSRFIQYRTVLSSDALPPLWEGPRVRSVTLAPLGQD